MNFLRNLYRRFVMTLVYLRRDISCRFGGYRHFFMHAKGARLLIYHGICESEPQRFNSLFITSKRFAEHLRFFKKYFNVISVDDFCRGRFDPHRFNVAISFDDGFANNLYQALPLLEEYEVPATFFVTAIRNEGYDILWNDLLTIASLTGPAQLRWRDECFRKRKGATYFSQGSGRTWSDMLRDTDFRTKQEALALIDPSLANETLQRHTEYWLQLSPLEIREASRSPYVTIGSHGYYHNDLGRLPESSVRDELVRSRQFLESVTGKRITQVAFPYGSYAAPTLRASLDAGYTQLFTTEANTPADKQAYPLYERMGINPYISTYNQMIAIVTGRYA